MVKLLAKVGLGSLIIVCVGLLGVAQTGLADTSKSSNYQFQETALGGISLYGAQSANFQASESAALLGLSNTASTNLQVNAGHLTTSDPTLSFIVNGFNVNLGNFSPAAAATATSTFSVIDYTSYGYVVQVVGSPPSYEGHTIQAMGTGASGPEPSQTGKEQFGINLVANISPKNPLGANPDNGDFGFGQVASDLPGKYDLSNNYRFVSGDIIAKAPKSSGKTTYTISYVVNVGALTPGGQYTGHQTLICTGTY